MGIRRILLEVSYDDDPESPRHIDLRGECDQLESRLARHLATVVDVRIKGDEVDPPKA